MLGLFSAVVTSRLRFFRIEAAGVQNAFFGGTAAAVFLAFSAIGSWSLSQPDVASDAGAMRAVQLLSFSDGGVAHTAALGLLLAGVSVPSLVHRLMPRWVCWLGLAIALVAELSTLSLLAPSLSILLPLARFPAIIWLVAAGAVMPRSHARGALA